MTDITIRLRKWFKDVNAVSAIDLMDEAADEIDRLREAIRRLADHDATITDEEREAVEWAAEKLATQTPTWQQNVVSVDAEGVRLASILRGLLERLG